MRPVEIWQVDAFSDQLFGGNPAGVIPDASGLSDDDMQNIAREMNHSETAFVLPPKTKGTDFLVRFFTPGAEVELCGHATVATFHVLAWSGKIKPDDSHITVVQETKAGNLPVDLIFEHGKIKAIDMVQAPYKGAKSAAIGYIAEALGIARSDLDEKFPVECAFTGLWAVMVAVKDNSVLSRLNNIQRHLIDSFGDQIDHISGVYIFSWNDGAPQARFFVSPRYEIIEDPVTGTATGAFIGYLHKHNIIGAEQPVTCKQGIEMGRPGIVTARVAKNGSVIVRGTAVPVFKTNLGSELR